MKLEAGKVYRARGGHKIECIAVWTKEVRGFQATCYSEVFGLDDYALDGTISKCSTNSFDLVEEWEEPERVVDSQGQKERGEVNDNVNHPKHYTSGKIEVIDFIEDQGLGFHLGNVVKYVARAGKKDPSKELEDLRKAQWYLSRYIESRTKENK